MKRCMVLLVCVLIQINCEGQVQSLYEKGKNEFLTGNYRTAVDDLKIAPKTPNVYDLNYLIAMSYLNLKEYKPAIAYFSKEITVNKSNYNAYIQKAYCNKMIGKLEDATRTLQSLILLKPDYFIAYSEKADINYTLKKYEAAIDDYNKALSINPRFEKALFNMGFCYLELKDTASACDSWGKIEDLDDFKDYEKAESTCKKYKRGKL